MAKKFGLGAGVDALMGKAGLSADDFLPNHEAHQTSEESSGTSQNLASEQMAAAQAVTKAVEAGNISAEVARGERKLPEGINVLGLRL